MHLLVMTIRDNHGTRKKLYVCVYGMRAYCIRLLHM